MDNIDISYNKADEYIDAPSGEYEKITLPFVGIYQSILDADIESTIEREVEWRDENGEEQYSKAEVNLKAIYRDIAERSAEMLGLTTAVYAGADSPNFYNYRDDYIFVWVKRSELDALYEKYGMSEKNIDELLIAIAHDNEDLHIEESDNPFYAVAWALYSAWYDSIGHCGYEVMDENIAYS